MHPEFTFELRIEPQASGDGAGLKRELTQWLQDHGVDSFVEGALDVDVNHDYDDPDRDLYVEQGGNTAPLSVYRYNRDSLEDLQSKLTHEFGDRLQCSIVASKTSGWMEGWKESFKPVATDRFYVVPPWNKDPRPNDRFAIVIEPGMAFGTGQHATTKLCLQILEQIPGQGPLLDVGTGTGVLAIAAAHLGYGPLTATDIEEDAVLATRTNFSMNDVSGTVLQASVPRGSTAKVVLANILTVVLKRIMIDLVAAVEVGGSLVLSGILDEECDEMVALVRESGLELISERHEQGWTGLHFKRTN